MADRRVGGPAGQQGCGVRGPWSSDGRLLAAAGQEPAGRAYWEEVATDCHRLLPQLGWSWVSASAEVPGAWWSVRLWPVTT